MWLNSCRAAIALSSLALYQLAAPARAQLADPRDFSDGCKAAIFDVERQIEDYGGAYVRNLSAHNPSNAINLPTSNPLTLVVYLGAHDGHSAGDLDQGSSAMELLTGQALLPYSQQIIGRCDSVVAVNFSVTEYQQRQFGWVDGRVREFPCSTAAGNGPLPWGERFCP